MKLPNPSFRLRIALLSAAISGVVLLGFGLVAWVWLNHERLTSLDREIRALAFRHPGWMNNRANYERLGSAIEFIFGEERKGQLVLLAMDATGTVRFRSTRWPTQVDPATLDLRLADDPGDAPPPPPNLPVNREPVTADGRPDPREPRVATSPETPGDGSNPGPSPGRGPGLGWGGRSGGGGPGSTLFTKVPRFFTATTSTTSWRLGILGNAQDRLVVGLDCAEMQSELGRMRNSFLLALPAALAAIGLGGWWVAGQALRPLRNISKAAEQVTARGLDQRIPASAEDPEIDRLIAVLNRMMDRLQSSFQQATRFSADASHELKTPLAIMQGELEEALQLAADGSRDQEVYASLLDETQRLKTITRSLLLLAQADSGHMPLSAEPMPLSTELDVITADARILAEAADLELTVQIAPDVVVSADRVLLRLAISNLVDNAIHYNQPGGRIDVVLESAEGMVLLRVCNTGPGIPPEEQPRVFDRFHRGNEARARRREGLGLGLSLAREITLAHRGDLVLVESGPGKTVFQLSLRIGVKH